MKQTLSLEEIYVPVEKQLEKVPEVIFDILATPNELTHEVIRHFFSRPGKFLRIALTFFGALIEKGEKSEIEEEKLLKLGAAFEIFHSATLIHDDIIDSAFVRRNIPTVHVKWNPQVAVLVGDYLHDRALEAIFSVGNPRITAAFLKTAATVCDGEIHELAEKNNFNLKEAEYLRIIEQKTASLIACAVESGGILAGLEPEKSEALRRFGRAFGMAFQIIDDCLDFTGEEHEFGKTLGADCEAGVLTLPLIRLIELVDEPAKSEVYKIFKSGFGSGRFETLKGLLMEYGTIDYAVSKAREWTEKARLELSVFPASPARTGLERLLDYVLERNR
ncbi:MAG: polyprenyl synthetase family protein [Candidatus Omnitrophica bacterium]|nr:polyprenyl synthetase family protein [Candidatus Omnitrophota bacterium]